MDAVSAADERNKIARFKSVLIHMVFDRLHRLEKVERIVLALPCLHQRVTSTSRQSPSGVPRFAVIKRSIRFSACR